MKICTALFAVILLGGLIASSFASQQLAPADDASIRRACAAYVSAWLANDKPAVLATLADDAVLLPAHGRPAVVGKPAIEAFWFPPASPPSSVDAFTSVVDEVGGVTGFGWARGSFDLTFTYDGKTRSQHGTYLMLFRREADGVWRITHRMWDDVIR